MALNNPWVCVKRITLIRRVDKTVFFWEVGSASRFLGLWDVDADGESLCGGIHSPGAMCGVGQGQGRGGGTTIAMESQ